MPVRLIQRHIFGFFLLLALLAAPVYSAPKTVADTVKDLLAADPLIRKNAVDYFATRPAIAAPVAPNILLLIDDPVEMVRDSAAICLGRLRDESAYSAILRAAKSGRLSYNAGAYALGRFGDRAVMEMIPALKSKRKNARLTALRYLTLSKDPRAVEPLMERFRNDRNSRLVLTVSFVEMGPVIHPPLIRLLSDPNPELAKAAADSLRRMNDPNAEDAVKLYLEHRSDPTPIASR